MLPDAIHQNRQCTYRHTRGHGRFPDQPCLGLRRQRSIGQSCVLQHSHTLRPGALGHCNVCVPLTMLPLIWRVLSGLTRHADAGTRPPSPLVSCRHAACPGQNLRPLGASWQCLSILSGHALGACRRVALVAWLCVWGGGAVFIEFRVNMSLIDMSSHWWCVAALMCAMRLADLCSLPGMLPSDNVQARRLG